MKNKKTLYSEVAYALGVVSLAFGTALMEKANFGMSMVVAPAYLLFLKISEYLPWFTFGMAEYSFQAVLLVAVALLWRRFKPMYLFCFVSAVIYGFTLDGMIFLVSKMPLGELPGRVVYYFAGMVVCSYGVSMLFNTYFAPEAYELLVKEISCKTGYDIHKTKTVYDCISCLIAVILSFLFFGFGHFEGVKLGTIFCALINGWLIGRCTAFTKHYFVFQDGLGLRKYFQ